MGRYFEKISFVLCVGQLDGFTRCVLILVGQKVKPHNRFSQSQSQSQLYCQHFTCTRHVRESRKRFPLSRGEHIKSAKAQTQIYETTLKIDKIDNDIKYRSSV